MTTQNTEAVAEFPEATVTELAKPDDVTAYGEERREQVAEDAPKGNLSDVTESLREKYDGNNVYA